MTLNKKFLLFLLLIITIIFSSYIFIQKNNSGNVAGVSIQEGNSQFIEINVRGGYSPSVIEAKSGITTYLKLKTNNTFDCSSSIFIPKLNVREFLPSTGEKTIEIAADKSQGVLNGSCSMGHYKFSINFV